MKTKTKHIKVTCDIGHGDDEHDAYVMPWRDPHDMWSAVTSYRDDEGGPVACPVEGCDQHLLWWEAGYAPGYRVCMAPGRVWHHGHDMSTIRHRFVYGDVDRDARTVTLILDATETNHQVDEEVYMQLPAPYTMLGTVRPRSP